MAELDLVELDSNITKTNKSVTFKSNAPETNDDVVAIINRLHQIVDEEDKVAVGIYNVFSTVYTRKYGEEPVQKRLFEYTLFTENKLQESKDAQATS